ncbi:MAG: tetraacyldisaccharide 4'-kinase, partial [Armatimonadota bacterium]
PTVQYLCKGLVQAGWRPAVLSYGYRGTLSGRLGIVSNGQEILLMPETAGDEPVMLAKSLPGIPVLVGKDRASSGRIAIDDLGANVLVLDDGFQVWKLHRDVDIALVRTPDPFDNGFVLPAGRLREPPSALRRANCIMAIGGVCDNDHRDDLVRLITKVAGEKPIVFARYEPANFYSLNDGSTIALKSLCGAKVLAVSGIANPSSFEETLNQLGLYIVEREHFSDHHIYSREDIERLSKKFAESGVDWIITTEKDAVKLESYELTFPILVLKIELQPENQPTFWKLISEKIGNPSQVSNTT